MAIPTPAITPQRAVEILCEAMPESTVADLAGTTQSTINRIRAGKQEPSYTLGAKLIALLGPKRAAALAVNEAPADE